MRGKAEICHPVAFLGLVGAFRSKQNGRTPSVRSTDEEATSIAKLIEPILMEGLAPSHCLKGRLGNSSFPRRQCSENSRAPDASALLGIISEILASNE